MIDQTIHEFQYFLTRFHFEIFTYLIHELNASQMIIEALPSRIKYVILDIVQTIFHPLGQCPEP